MYTSRSSFQVCWSFIFLLVSLCTGFYIHQYSATAIRFQEYNDNELCAVYPLILELVILGASSMFIGLLLNSFIVYLDEARIKNLQTVCYSPTKNWHYPVYVWIALLFSLCLLIAQCIQKNDFRAMVECPILAFGFASFACSISMIFPYDNVDVSYAVNIRNSIGAAYAYGAYNSFYKIVAKRFIQCAKEWEEKNEREIVKKLIIICPSSCNVNGNLEQNGNNINIIDDFVTHIGDQGANMNRKYKHTIYGIKNSENTILVIAEFASPLGVLWEQQQQATIDEENLKFTQECFIFTLKKLLKDLPCIVVKYDVSDKNPSNSLDRFLLSVVEEAKRLDLSKSYKVKEV